jgi:hypothetical protein
MQSWMEQLVVQQVDGTALTNTTTATSIIAPAAKRMLPANYCDYIGRRLLVKARGRISNIVTTPGTLTLDVRFGSIVVFNGGAIALNTTAKTNVSWELEVELVVRSIGATAAATLFGVGSFCSESVVGAAAGVANTAMLPASAPAVGTGFDSTVTNIVDLFGTWSIANAGNSIQTHHFSIDALN